MRQALMCRTQTQFFSAHRSINSRTRAPIRMPTRRTWCDPILIRSTRSHGSMFHANRSCFRCPTPTAAITCCRCSTCGPMCSPWLAAARSARAPAIALVAPDWRRTLPQGRKGRRAHADVLDRRAYADQRSSRLRQRAQRAGWLPAGAVCKRRITRRRRISRSMPLSTARRHRRCRSIG